MYILKHNSTCRVGYVHVRLRNAVSMSTIWGACQIKLVIINDASGVKLLSFDALVVELSLGLPSIL